MSGFGHGSVGTREQAFTHLLPLRAKSYPTHELLELANSIKSEPDSVKDGPDPEENLLLPAGYTYFGQFIDHDLTFDNTSSLNPVDIGSQDRLPSNLRTPRFDLDSLYGDGPDAQPFMYAEDGATLLYKNGTENQVQPTASNTKLVEDFKNQADQDLLRSPNGRAIVGDKRNDENSIISQIQLSFVKYHNAVVVKLKQNNHRLQDDQKLTGTALFEAAQNEVRWAYQKIVIEDFLPRIVNADVLEGLKDKTRDQRAQNYALYTEDKRENLPREFVVAAYRFGHSGVRFGYRLNNDKRFSIFPGSDNPNPDDDSLLGFEPLPSHHVIDNWARFFPLTVPGVLPNEFRDEPADNKERPEVRLQLAYKIDSNLVDPLGVLPSPVLPTSQNVGGVIKEVKDAISPDTLPDKKVVPPRPSLALLNLLRGNNYRVQGGQQIVKALQDKGFTQAIPLTSDQLSVRRPAGKNSAGDALFKFEPIAESLQKDTPLWFYILAEGQAPLVDHFGVEESFSEVDLLNGVGAKTQLGWVGGRIVAEVFYGLLDSDHESYINKAPEGWKPILAGDPVIFANLLKFAGQNIEPPPTSTSTYENSDYC
ncbi:MAG: peroxidase family protein [Nostoc sp.]|uniref:peroxidase family protein n=1 Tax=Nostoc sp. TaxID=1180 RepID=UPI002FF6A9E1